MSHTIETDPQYGVDAHVSSEEAKGSGDMDRKALTC